MQNQNLQRNFNKDLIIGEEAERLAYEVLINTNSIQSVIHTPIEYWKDKFQTPQVKDLPYEFDFLINDKWGIEVKSLEGNYPTLAIELWADDYKTRRPGWIKSTTSGHLKFVMFYRRHENAFYLFDASSLYEYIKYNGKLTRAKNGNRDGKGWIRLVGWENKLAGFVCKVKID